jgi:hypothetical protein
MAKPLRQSSQEGLWYTADHCPTRDYTPEQTEFMLAMDKYKRENRRPFPNWSEVLAVAISLGYRKMEPLEKRIAELETKVEMLGRLLDSALVMMEALAKKVEEPKS